MQGKIRMELETIFRNWGISSGPLRICSRTEVAVINVKIELHREGPWNGRIYTSVTGCAGLMPLLYTGFTFNVIWRLNAAKAAFRE